MYQKRVQFLSFSFWGWNVVSKLGRTKMMINIPPKEYFRQCVTQSDYYTMDRSDYGPKMWPQTFPVSWKEHVVLARINRKMEAKNVGRSK